ncbi:MAG: class I tRNA ligase family protein [Patescibacteria group bacterium]
MAEDKKTQHHKDSTVPKSPLAEREERVLQFWNAEKIFEKTLTKEAPSGEFIFYDGPPFATGTPHYGHILASTIKDVIPRYKTMRGFHVPRRWGWDCHGLPIENMVEKELGLKSKKDIEEYGLEQFTGVAREFVLRYADIWRSQIPRFGRWVDMDDDYRTMDSSYTESVWWVFKTLYKKGLIYEGFKSMQLCPRCGTTLSNFEVNQGYKDITDISVYAKFELTDNPGTFLLAWTTTPWTLPGNVALAVNPDIDYVKIEIAKEGVADAEKMPNVFYILAKERLSAIKETFTILDEMKGSKLVGHSYKPVFDYYANLPEAKGKAWKIYGAEFVTTTDGTGIVHVAPAFGSDDYELAQKHKLPLIQHVSIDGKFKPEVTDFAGMDVKPKAGKIKGEDGKEKEEKDAHQKADIEVVKYLAHKGLLFAKEKIIHSYPHCWRCETPLLNYASSSWFVSVTEFKDALVEENKKINWVPKEVGQYRFGNWLEGARDWAISRARYWGAPLPVWKSEDGKEVVVVGTKDYLKELLKPRNEYLLMRHGEAESNVLGIISSDINSVNNLTEKGRSQVEESARHLKKEKIDLIIASPFLRTRQTAEIVAKAIGYEPANIVYEERFREISVGVFNGKKIEEYTGSYSDPLHRFYQAPEGGETLTQVRKRMMEALYEIDKKYEGKKILIVTHETPGWIMFSGAEGLTKRETLDLRSNGTGLFLHNADVRMLRFVHLPHNHDYELDYHRPFIDEVVLTDKHGKPMKRVKDVFDCWFESGSMPYGEAQYKGETVPHFDPMSNKGVGYPADFIAEGLDQTRGWFYSMLVLGVALFGKAPFKNVIVNGLVLAEDGKKMSKSLKNYPDPMDVVNRYGIDAVRYFMLQSPVVASEDLRFTEKGVDEVVKKIVNRLDNVVTFYETYKNMHASALGEIFEESAANPESLHVLDQWIVARFDQMLEHVTKGLEKYELHNGCRPINDFIEDLSVWYLRRSRDRFKSDNIEDVKNALQTTRYVLERLSRVLAPFMPFFAEDIYSRTMGSNDPQSVHLASWPHIDENENNPAIVTYMAEVRSFVTAGLEARAKAGIKVRQPLAALTIQSKDLADKPELLELIQDEVNVKKVLANKDLATPVELDTNLTNELKDEGILRELMRSIQDLRKENGLNVGEQATLVVAADEKAKAFMQRFEKELKQVTQLVSIEFQEQQTQPGAQPEKATAITAEPFVYHVTIVK